MRPVPGVLLSALLLAAIGSMSGCGTSPPVRFFTLASEGPRAAPAGSPAYSVVVGPVTVPELVDRQQLVLRASPNRVEIAEQARWAAPLKSEIPRVIADHLGRLLGDVRTSTFSERASGVPDYRVVIDIQRFETVPGEGATIQALWTVRPRVGEAVTGQSLTSEAAGPGYDELVAAHSRALGAVSREVAAAIAAIRARAPSGPDIAR